ncbi:hypothetical protein HNP40_003033 [Mycobacteroides chelonae]|nr:hypothetical protein [Mycobacteroides chelonae]
MRNVEVLGRGYNLIYWACSIERMAESIRRICDPAYFSGEK